MNNTNPPTAADLPPIVAPYRHARGMVAVRCPSVGGWKSRASRLAEALRGRWVHRADGYVMTPAKAERLAAMWRDGWDANPYTLKLEPPVPAIESTPPVPATEIDSTPPVPATVTHLAAWREKQARQREICGTTPARTAQNPRTRLRFDHASGEWMAVFRWHG